MIEKESREIRGFRVHYLKAGDGGNEILILPGWKGTKEDWKENISELKGENTCIAIDLPGFGESDSPNKVWGIEEYSDFVDNLVKSLGWDKFVLVGKSFGGRVAIRYAIKYPERLKGLVLVSSAGIEKKNVSTRAKIFAAKSGRILLDAFPFSLQQRARKSFYQIMGIELEKDNLKMEIKKKVTNQNLTRYLKRIDVPTLVVWGDRDQILPVSMGRRIAQRIPGSQFHIIEEGDHYVHQKRPRQFNKILQNFLRELE